MDGDCSRFGAFLSLLAGGNFAEVGLNRLCVVGTDIFRLGAAKHLRMAVQRVWRAPWCVPDVMVWWNKTVDRDDGVVPSPVLVIVDESALPCLLVWMMLTGVALGAASLSLLWW